MGVSWGLLLSRSTGPRAQARELPRSTETVLDQGSNPVSLHRQADFSHGATWDVRSPSFLVSHSLLFLIFALPSPQPDGAVNVDSDEGEEPSPEALVRYLSMRRHTVGVADPR